VSCPNTFDLFRAGDVATAVKLVEHVRRCGDAVPADLYRLVLSRCVRSGQRAATDALVACMRADGLQVSDADLSVSL